MHPGELRGPNPRGPTAGLWGKIAASIPSSSRGGQGTRGVQNVTTRGGGSQAARLTTLLTHPYNAGMALIEINRNPSAKEVGLFGKAWLPLMLTVLGGLAWRRDPASVTPWIWWGGAALAEGVAWVFPAAMKWVYIAAMVISFPIGWVVSHVLLALIFYGLVTPMALVMRWQGRDVLGRKFPTDAASHWSPHTPVTDTARYYRQF